MINSPDQLDELIDRMNKNGDFSSWQKDPSNSGSINIITTLKNIPKTEVPKPNLLRVKNTIFDRISLSQGKESQKSFGGVSRLLPRMLKITGGLVGGFMIVISVTVATAAAALESVPGQTIYPVKKIVENVQMQLASSQEQKTNLQIKFANTRVEEMETIIKKGKEGKVSEAEVQKVVEKTIKDIENTSKIISQQSKEEPKVDVLTKIVDLNNKQVAVIQAAQVDSEGTVKTDFEKALETSITTKEKAIEDIERIGLKVEDKPLLIALPLKEDGIKAEGKLTNITETSINIGTAQFLLTKTTEYVNIKQVDLTVGIVVKITGEIKDKKSYATKIEFVSPPKAQPVEEPKAETPTEEPDSEEDSEANSENTDPQ